MHGLVVRELWILIYNWEFFLHHYNIANYA